MRSERDFSSESGPLAAPLWPEVLLLQIFAAGLLIVMPNFNAFYFGDEHFYTDSAIRMHQTGQILTPIYPDGSPRFNKPIITYWMILASFHAFGISVMSARLASLAAGLATLALTGILTRRLFGSRDFSLLAMLVLASNVEFINASLRSMPDIFLCLAVTASLVGFAGLLFSQRPTRRDAWAAYVGAGFAIATKGLLGVVLLAFIALFAVAHRNRAMRLRSLFNPAPMLTGLVLALGWFAALYLKYGSQFVNGFMGDQVGNRLSGSISEVIGNAIHYSIGLALPFLPWSILLAAGFIFQRSALKGRLAAHAPAFLFIAGWQVCLMVVFSPANLTRTRYLLPAFPLLAAATAVLLSEALSHPSVQRTARLMVRLLAIGLLPGALVFSLAAASLNQPRLAFAAAGLLLLSLVLLKALRSSWRDRLPLLMALVPFVVLLDYYALIRPLFPLTPAYETAAQLQEAGVTRMCFPKLNKDMSDDQLARYKEKYASQIRLISGGGIRVDRLDFRPYLASEIPRPPMICLGDDARRFPSNRFTLVRSGSAMKPNMGTADFIRILGAQDRKAAFEALFVSYYLAFPKQAEETACLDRADWKEH